MGITFTQVLNLSISASWLVLAVALIRLLLKKAPKAFHCALWALVAIRLLCPVSFESELSLIPSREVIPERYLYMEPAQQDAPAKLEIVTNPVYENPVTIDTETTVDRVQSCDLYATLVWLTGMGAMVIYAAYSYMSLRLRVRMAGWVSGNVWECDELDSPFILGLLRPRIYLPSALDEDTKRHVLAHENAHLKRLDHLWKPLGFFLLTVHWFNPIIWLGYILLCRDIELACDEKVIQNLDKPAVRAYSEALVRCSVNHRMIAACPLAFGEVGVKGRIKSMLNYKKPGFWVIVIAVLASIAVAVCFLTDPAPEEITLERILSDESCTILHIQEEPDFRVRIPKDALPADVTNGREHTFEPGAVPVAEYGDIRFFLRSARTSGDELLLEIRIDQPLTEEGILLMTEHPFEDDPDKDADVAHGEVRDAGTVYANAAVRRGLGTEQFSVGIKLDVWNQAQEYVEFEMTGIWCVSYTFGEPPETTWPTEETNIVITLYAPYLPNSVDRPSFSLYSDGTFSMTTSLLSSYLGVGTYTREGDVLTLVTDDGLNTWTFTAEGDGYRFDRANSSPIRFYPDLKSSIQLVDGTLFLPQKATILADTELEDAIRTAILEENRDNYLSGEIRTAAWKILGTEEVSGTPLAGSSDHRRLLTVYLQVLYQEYTAWGSELIPQSGGMGPAALTFDLSDYSLTEYWTPRDGTYYSEDLRSRFPESVLEVLERDDSNELLQQQCFAQAEYWLENSLPTDEQIEALFDTISSSPAQYSGPGTYLDAHPEEFQQLLGYGDLTLRWCSGQFAAGEELGIKGHVMAITCQSIIANTEECTVETYASGQDWYRQMTDHAFAMLDELGPEELEKQHPACRLLLDSLLMICYDEETP